MLKVDLDYYGKTYGFDIKNEDKWNSLKTDWERRKFLVDKLVDAGEIERPDSSLGYGTDQLQRGLYKATDVFIRLTGIEALEQWGKEGADAQLEDMQAGRYEPFHTKSLRETYNQDDLIAALDWTREKAIENAPSYTIGVGGTALGVGLGLLGFVPAGYRRVSYCCRYNISGYR